MWYNGATLRYLRTASLAALTSCVLASATSASSQPEKIPIGTTGGILVSAYGSLWTTDINMVVGGSAFIQYSTQALALANQIGPGQNLPSKLVINSMIDCADVPAGTNNC